MKKKRFITGLVLGCLAWISVVAALLVVVKAYSGDSLYLDEDYVARLDETRAAEDQTSGKAGDKGKENKQDTDSSDKTDDANESGKGGSGSEPLGANDSAGGSDEKSDKETASSDNTADTVPEVSYRIDGDNVPKPDPEKFVKVSNTDADKVMEVIKEARENGLFSEDEKVVFSPDVEFVSWGDIRYYYDDSIFAVVWKEMKDGRYMTYGEIKVRDASQFRRKLADDTYGSPTQYFCTQLDEQVNSVVARSAIIIS